MTAVAREEDPLRNSPTDAIVAVLLCAQCVASAIGLAMVGRAMLSGRTPLDVRHLANGLPAIATLAIGVTAIIDLRQADRRRRRLVHENRRLSIAAHSDALTGLGNRRSFEAGLRQAWREGSAEASPVCLLIVDADHFKSFNDSFGHVEGDRLLKAIGRALEMVLDGTGGRAYRHGGEEFAVILPGSDARRGLELAERVMRSVAALGRSHPDNPTGRLTVSIGVADAVPANDPDGPDRMVQAADDALYEAKRGGRARIRVAAADHDQPLPRGRDTGTGSTGGPGIAGLEIVLGNGRVIRINQPVDPDSFASLVAMVERE